MPDCNKGMGCLVCKGIIYDYCSDCDTTATVMGHREFIEHVMTFCDIDKPIRSVSG